MNSVADQDPGSGALLSPGSQSGMEKNSDPVPINIADHISTRA